MYEKALEIKKQVHDEQHVSVAQTYNSVGIVFMEQSNKNEAHSLFSKASEIYVKVVGLPMRTWALIKRNKVPGGMNAGTRFVKQSFINKIS